MPSGNSPKTIPDSVDYAYNRDDIHAGKAPGGLAVRYEIRIATGLEGKRVAAAQAEAVKQILTWLERRYAESRERSSGSAAMLRSQAPADAEPVPFAFIGRTSTLELQDPVGSLRKQVRESQAKLPPGGFIAAWFWDVESGGMDLDQRGQGSPEDLFPDIGIPRDGGVADLLTEAAGPHPRFVAVICQNIERSARDMFYSLQLEKKLQAAEIPLFASDEPINLDGINAATILFRRNKQVVAEWLRLNIKEDARLGLEQHALDGYNIGTPGYGYRAEKIRHPNPMKASQGLPKTRLALDPPCVPAVEMIFYWRTVEKLGARTIARPAERRPRPLPGPQPGRLDRAGRLRHPAQPQVHRVHGLRPHPQDQRQDAAGTPGQVDLVTRAHPPRDHRPGHLVRRRSRCP